MKRPKMDATAAGIGGSTAEATSVSTTASATPARIARQLSGGISRRELMTGMYDAGPAKKKPIREAYADRWVRERCQLGIEQVRRSLVALKLTSSSSLRTSLQPSSSLALVNHLLLATHCRYIDTSASQMSTHERSQVAASSR